jgi:hypothetical protein
MTQVTGPHEPEYVSATDAQQRLRLCNPSNKPWTRANAYGGSMPVVAIEERI